MSGSLVILARRVFLRIDGTVAMETVSEVQLAVCTEKSRTMKQLQQLMTQSAFFQSVPLTLRTVSGPVDEKSKAELQDKIERLAAPPSVLDQQSKEAGNLEKLLLPEQILA